MGVLLGERHRGLLPVEHRLLPAVLVLRVVDHARVLQVEGLLDDLVGAHAAGAVGRQRPHVGAVASLALDPPLRRDGRVPHRDALAHPVGRLQELDDEVPHVVGRDPRRAEAHADVRWPDVGRQGGAQRLGVAREGGIRGGRGLGDAQLRAYVAGQVLVGGLPFGLPRGGVRRAKYLACEPRSHLVLRDPREPRHIGQVDLPSLRQGRRQRLLGRVRALHGHVRPDGSLPQDVGLPEEAAVLVEHLERAQQRVG